jgi:hypothetical protein
MEWISVKDKLPELHEDKILWDGEVMMIGSLTEITPKCVFPLSWSTDSEWTFFSPIYWMPLPCLPDEHNTRWFKK